MTNEAEACSLCHTREGTNDDRRLMPIQGAPTQIAGRYTSIVLKCLDCGQEWTSIDEWDTGAHNPRLAKGRVILSPDGPIPAPDDSN